ncbi:MAG: flagellar protein FlaG [Shewanella sp.]|uniref:flagellar protein FlaG n=1 Tax=Shewanella sp. TaxID=50422 RepID=UPI00300137D4
MMEINSNTAQFASKLDLNKVDLVVSPITDVSNSEQMNLNESSFAKPVSESESVNKKATDRQKRDVQLQQVAADLTDMVAMMQKGLKFSVDDDSGERVIKVQDVESGDIIRQIPSEEALKLAEKLSEVSGILMKIEV